MAYIKETWTNGAGNAIDAASLTHMETQYDEAMSETATRDIPKAIVDAKGDLIVATGPDTVTRVAVGADGTFLKADSAAPAGVSYGTPTGGSALLPPRPPINTWLIPAATSINYSDSSAFGTNFGTMLPILVPRAVTIDALVYRVTTAAAGVSVGAAVWSANSDGFPGTLVGSVVGSGAAAGVISVNLAAPVALPAGLYWTGGAVSATGTIRLAVGWEPSNHIITDTGQLANLFPNDAQSARWQAGGAGAYNAPANVSAINYAGGSYAVLVGMRRSA